MKSKSSSSDKLSANALAQRQFRARMREKGLVPHQVYVLPMHKITLDAVEVALRHPLLPQSLATLTQDHLAAMTLAWTTTSLQQALLDQQRSAAWNPEFHNDTPDSLTLVLPEHGDLPVHLAVAGQQIMASVVLFPATSVTDRAALNDAALRVGPHTVFSGVGIQRVGDEDIYIAYGQLSARSSLDSIIEEIEALGHNALDFVSVFSTFLSPSTGA